MSDKNIDWLKRLQLLSKALEKNGVKTEVWVELETKISGYELDFTEHDKVFEDKITKLEENVGYYKDSLSRVEKNCDKLYHENKELKQRIADLESKDSVKPMRIEFYADNGEPFTPLEVANSLINQNAFKVDELRELAEHLQVYCRHHNDKKEDVISF